MESTLEPGPSRRSFIDWLLGTSAAAFIVSALYPVSRYLVPPPAGESSAASVTLPMRAEDVKPNTGQIFKFGSKPAILVRTAAGELRAFSAVCTHLNCTVQYRPDLAEIWCACHNGHFDLNVALVSRGSSNPLVR